MKQLAKILANESNSDFIENLIIELFTSDEQGMIKQRLRIIALLRTKMPQYEIAKKLNASLCSITRGAKELKKQDSALGKIADNYLVPEMDYTTKTKE